MGFFNRRKSPTDGNGTDATNESRHGRSNIMNNRERQPKKSKGAPDYHDNALHKRPTFGQWIKVTWTDILTMVIMGALGLGIYEAPPAPSRSFPVYFADGQIVYPEFAYPLRHEIVPIWLAAFLAFFVPAVFILIMQIRIRSFWDVNNAIIGLLYSLITAAVFQVFLKCLIGGLRPHFLDVCKPDLPVGGIQAGNGFGKIMYDRSICTGDTDTINDSLESFPSGHTTAAFGGFVYLSLYLNAKLKVWSNYHPSYWKLIVTYMPILGAVLIGGSLSIDEYHNWYDIFAGAVIGTVMAFSAYRMLYASVWDFRFNHIPLVRHVPFAYGGGQGGFDGFHDAMWTRKAGWGSREGGAGWSGAPFDVAQGSIGGGGFGGQQHGQQYHERPSGEWASESGRPRRQSIPRKAVPTTPRNDRGDDIV